MEPGPDELQARPFLPAPSARTCLTVLTGFHHARWTTGQLQRGVQHKALEANTCFTLCRYGYGSAEFYYQILEGYANASIPLDTFVSDSQYMDHDQEFTLGYTFSLGEMQVRRGAGSRCQLNPQAQVFRVWTDIGLPCSIHSIASCWWAAHNRPGLSNRTCRRACDPIASLCRGACWSGVLCIRKWRWHRWGLRWHTPPCAWELMAGRLLLTQRLVWQLAALSGISGRVTSVSWLSSPQAFLAMLRRQNQRWVPILDPSIHVNKGYAAYDSGIARDVFVKDITGHPYVGQVPVTAARLGWPSRLSVCGCVCVMLRGSGWCTPLQR